MTRFLALIVAVFVACLPEVTYARIIPLNGNYFNQTTNPPTSDIHCDGGQIRGNTTIAATEVCQDYTGSLLPTTSGTTTQNLGSTSLPWANVYTVTAVNTGNETNGTAGSTLSTGLGGTAATQSTINGISVQAPAFEFLLTASSVVAVNSSLMVVGGTGASTTLTSQPEISTTTVVGGSTLLPFGTYLTVTSTQTAANVVFTSSTTSNATGLILGAATRTITKNKTLLLWLDNITVPAVWREIAFGNL